MGHSLGLFGRATRVSHVVLACRYNRRYEPQQRETAQEAAHFTHPVDKPARPLEVPRLGHD
jgi:hypothetical protein